MFGWLYFWTFWKIWHYLKAEEFRFLIFLMATMFCGQFGKGNYGIALNITALLVQPITSC